jgi:hypothetical protein
MADLRGSHMETPAAPARKKRPEERAFVGWREWVALPSLGIPALKAKIDTGARTSSLHAFAMQTYQEGARTRVRFCVHPLQSDDELEVVCHADVIDERFVTNSGGYKEHRLVIEAPVQVGSLTWTIEVTLTDRRDMRFRMLLGRQALRQAHLLVNPARSYLLGPRLKARALYRALR